MSCPLEEKMSNEESMPVMLLHLFSFSCSQSFRETLFFHLKTSRLSWQWFFVFFRRTDGWSESLPWKKCCGLSLTTDIQRRFHAVANTSSSAAASFEDSLENSDVIHHWNFLFIHEGKRVNSVFLENCQQHKSPNDRFVTILWSRMQGHHQRFKSLSRHPWIIFSCFSCLIEISHHKITQNVPFIQDILCQDYTASKWRKEDKKFCPSFSWKGLCICTNTFLLPFKCLWSWSSSVDESVFLWEDIYFRILSRDINTVSETPVDDYFLPSVTESAKSLVVVNRLFLYAVYDKNSGAVNILGRVSTI